MLVFAIISNMRPVWSGSISFGLVNIPVKMFSGAHSKEGLDLDLLHKEDHAPIRYARICRKDGEEVPWEDVVKGYEYREGDYVVLTQKDFDKANEKRAKMIDIQHFIDKKEVDIRYFEKPYYLEPTKGGHKAYALLREALEDSHKLALVRFVVRMREHLGVITVVGDALVLVQMRFPAELREAGDLEFPSKKEVSKEEIKIALKLINQDTKHFVPEDYKDVYLEELEEIIEAKIKGQKPKKHSTKPKDTSAKDLMGALKESLKDKK